MPAAERALALDHRRAQEPTYRQQEMIQGVGRGLFGLSAHEMERLSDDRIGRALDRLFDADRAAFLTDVVFAVGQRFGVRFEGFHNNSTSIRFCGQYCAAPRRALHWKMVPAITYGYSTERLGQYHNRYRRPHRDRI